MALTEQRVNDLKMLLQVESLPIVWTESQIVKLGLRSVSSLRRDRVVGGGIPFIKDKGQILYPVIAVLEWMDQNTRVSTSDQD